MQGKLLGPGNDNTWDESVTSGDDITDFDTTSITEILNSVDGREGVDQVFSRLYVELKPIARRLLAGARGETISPTVLVHEAYAKLIGSEVLNVTGRRHFFALCARIMRQIVVDYARGKLADKRGGGQATVALTDEGVIDISRPESLVAMDEALEWLEQHDPRLVELIHLRVYAGLELPDIAPMLEVTTRQLQRDWQRARAWLSEALLESGD